MNEHDNKPHRESASAQTNQSEQAVGYGKPPVHSRFKKGNPGRPKGASKQSFSMADIFTAAMTRRLRIRRGDRIVSMRVAEIYVERLIVMATQGSASEMTKLLAMIAKHAPHMLAAPEIEARITYHRAPGSEVELPPLNLWKEPKK